jgi:hypothetical protein
MLLGAFPLSADCITSAFWKELFAESHFTSPSLTTMKNSKDCLGRELLNYKGSQ